MRQSASWVLLLHSIASRRKYPLLKCLPPGSAKPTEIGSHPTSRAASQLVSHVVNWRYGVVRNSNVTGIANWRMESQDKMSHGQLQAALLAMQRPWLVVHSQQEHSNDTGEWFDVGDNITSRWVLLTVVPDGKRPWNSASWLSRSNLWRTPFPTNLNRAHRGLVL